MTPQDRAKKAAAEAAVKYVESGMKLGLGTGSTMKFALEAIGRRVREEGLDVVGIPTSEASAAIAREQGIPLTDFATVQQLDLAMDGADEIDLGFQMIKGGGGALLREKITASAASRVIILVDPSKLVTTLGAFPLPVEVVPFAAELFLHRMQQRGVPAQLRRKPATLRPKEGESDLYRTDEGNLIVDCRFQTIEDPKSLHAELVGDPCVVETGLFIDLCHTLVIGSTSDTKVVEHGPDGITGW